MGEGYLGDRKDRWAVSERRRYVEELFGKDEGTAWKRID